MVCWTEIGVLFILYVSEPKVKFQHLKILLQFHWKMHLASNVLDIFVNWLHNYHDLCRQIAKAKLQMFMSRW